MRGLLHSCARGGSYYSADQETWKLVPSDESFEALSSATPLALTRLICETQFVELVSVQSVGPKALMAADVETEPSAA
jgi:hypothetical protein